VRRDARKKAKGKLLVQNIENIKKKLPRGRNGQENVECVGSTKKDHKYCMVLKIASKICYKKASTKVSL
jgi:hypothetical protein